MSVSTQWQLARQAAKRYQQILEPAILGPAARALVDSANLRAGETVLDVGCGTGAAARFAATRVSPSGRVVGIDINPDMIQMAKSLPPANGLAIEWYVQSAYQLPVNDQTVDVALFAQTLQFLDDKPRALSEVKRALKPGGRIALGLWCDVRKNPYFDGLVKAMTLHVGSETAAGLQAAFSLSSADEIRALLAGAGFRDIVMSVQTLVLALPPPEVFVPRHISATPMAAGYRATQPAARQAVIAAMTRRLAHYSNGSDIRVPFKTHLVLGKYAVDK
jgi:ubiquinone/menaquinone biosynthesis C-methylase UbiE